MATRYTQPQAGPLEIDWGNPLTRGLGFALVPSNSLQDAVTRIVPNTTAGVAQSTGSAGVAIGYASSTYPPLYPGSALQASTNYTLLSVLADNSGRGAYRSFIDADGGGGAFRCFQFRLNASNEIEFIPFDTSQVPYTVTGATAVPATGVQVLGARISNNVTDVWLNGRKDGSGAASNIVATFAVPGAELGLCARVSGAGQNFTGQLFLVVYWAIPLSDVELTIISANPWQLFKAPRRVLRVAAASNPVLTSSAVTSASGTVSSEITGFLSGASISSGQGSFGVFVTQGVVGATISSLAGSAGSSVLASMIGGSAIFAPGSVSAPGAFLIGSSVTSSPGILSNNITIGLVGQNFSARTGMLAPLVPVFPGRLIAGSLLEDQTASSTMSSQISSGTVRPTSSTGTLV